MIWILLSFADYLPEIRTPIYNHLHIGLLGEAWPEFR